MATSHLVNDPRNLFCAYGCLMLAFLLFTIFIDGLPFRRDLLTPWMAALLVDFYINIVALGAWVSYKESLCSAIIWVVLLVCLGSITTCGYIVLQFLNLSSSQASSHDPVYYVLVRDRIKDVEPKPFSVLTARVLFSLLGCLMLGTLIYTLLTDGSPFREELLTLWVPAMLLDFYINVIALSAWVVYRESSRISAFLWISLLICFGSIATCGYIVHQLFQLSSQDPVYLVLLNSQSRNDFKMPNTLPPVTSCKLPQKKSGVIELHGVITIQKH